jgi:hypothetical protein
MRAAVILALIGLLIGGMALPAPAVQSGQAFVKDLRSRTVMQIVQEVDTFYKENPGKLDTPVIEVVMRRCTSLCPPGTSGGKAKQ